MSLNIIGISALYHDSACCLLQDGVVKVAVQEERFTRIKHDSSMPCNAFKFCLESMNLSITDIDCIAYYEEPTMKLARQLWSGYDIQNKGMVSKMDPNRPEYEIIELLGYTGPIEIINHHLSHAASSFYFSGFDEAAIISVDGVGEWATTTYGYGKNEDIKLFETVNFPDSIGLFYSAITGYLGFRVNSGEYKVMGLAPYGQPTYVDKLRKLIELKGKGQYKLNMEYFDFVRGDRMYSDKLVELLGHPARVGETEILQYHKDIARSLQYVLEEILLEKANYLYDSTRSKNLCLAGGVALNCVANSRLLKDSPFEKIFIQPAAGDSGCALGAAAVAYMRLKNESDKIKLLSHVYLGPEFSNEEIKQVLDATALKYQDFQGKSEDLIKKSAELLAQGKVIGWFQGKMEFGPRALGSRSILADPRVSDMRQKINFMVKKRECFRPFAPAVLEEKMSEHFDLPVPSPYMLLTCNVISSIKLPAITHVDNSARVQTVNDESSPVFAKLIREFDKLTNCPILLNTSFNVRGEPIVHNPIDALICFATTEIDCLVLEDFLIERSNNSLKTLEMILNRLQAVKTNKGQNLYSFI